MKKENYIKPQLIIHNCEIHNILLNNSNTWNGSSEKLEEDEEIELDGDDIIVVK